MDAMVLVHLFFVFGIAFFLRYLRYPELGKIFISKLFKTSLLIRIFSVVFLYFFFYNMTSSPNEFHAGDALNYHNMGVHLSDLFLNGDYILILKN